MKNKIARVIGVICVLILVIFGFSWDDTGRGANIKRQISLFPLSLPV